MLQSRPKILIVDDSATSRAVLRRRLAGVDAEVLESASAASALIQVQSGAYALMLLDLQMPDLDGFEALRRLRALPPPTSSTPVILMGAGLAEPAPRQRAFELGAVDCFAQKPVDAEVLQQHARNFVDLFHNRVQLQREVANLKREIARLNDENQRQRASRSELLHQATHDALTGLPNRALFEDRLSSAIQRARRNQRLFALAYLDLDRLKQVNDQHGHAAGDAMLVAVARQLQFRLRASDTVARLGGDEFGVILEDLDAVDSAIPLGEKLLAAVSESLNPSDAAQGQALALQPAASVGLAVWPLDASDGAELTRLADRAMYRVKARGGGGVERHRSVVSS